MENIERSLEAFTWTKPPEWLKSEALAAAQNEIIRQRTRRRIQTMLLASIAAGLLLAAVGHFVANLIAPLRESHAIAVHAGPVSPFPGAIELLRREQAHRGVAGREGLDTELVDGEYAAPARTGDGEK